MYVHKILKLNGCLWVRVLWKFYSESAYSSRRANDWCALQFIDNNLCVYIYIQVCVSMHIMRI